MTELVPLFIEPHNGGIFVTGEGQSPNGTVTAGKVAWEMNDPSFEGLTKLVSDFSPCGSR